MSERSGEEGADHGLDSPEGIEDPSGRPPSALLEGVLGQLPVGLRIHDSRSGAIVFENAEARRLLAEGAQLLRDGVPLPRAELPLTRALAHREPTRAEELTVRAPDGSEHAITVSAGPMPGHNGEPTVAWMLIWDTTATKQTERELVQALQLRDEFLSIASHELNTPLAALLLSLQLFSRKLARGAGPSVPIAVVQRALAGPIQQVQKLSRMLSDLLDLSRVRNGRLILEVDVFDLCEAVREAVDRLRPQARQRGAELHLDAPGAAIGYWDRLRIEQVVTNLVSNAIKYGSGLPIEVAARVEGEQAVLSVVDHGIGISDGDLPRIFDRFERATPRRQRESLGLGLFITRQIVQAHHGTIEVQSAPGKGSRFTVRLPLRHLDHPSQPGVGDGQ